MNDADKSRIQLAVSVDRHLEIKILILKDPHKNQAHHPRANNREMEILTKRDSMEMRIPHRVYHAWNLRWDRLVSQDWESAIKPSSSSIFLGSGFFLPRVRHVLINQLFQQVNAQMFLHGNAYVSDVYLMVIMQPHFRMRGPQHLH